MIREYHSDSDDDFKDCSDDVNNGTCFIAEFNLQIDTSGKMQNGRTLKQSLNEALIDLRKDSSLIIKPKPKVPIAEKLRKEKKNDANERDLERVRILENSKVKIAGRNAVPFAAITLTFLFLTYKYVISYNSYDNYNGSEVLKYSEIFSPLLTPIWGIFGTSRSVIFGQKKSNVNDCIQFCGFFEKNNFGDIRILKIIAGFCFQK